MLKVKGLQEHAACQVAVGKTNLTLKAGAEIYPHGYLKRIQIRD